LEITVTDLKLVHSPNAWNAESSLSIRDGSVGTGFRDQGSAPMNLTADHLSRLSLLPVLLDARLSGKSKLSGRFLRTRLTGSPAKSCLL
jgi:hypothetical protein